MYLVPVTEVLLMAGPPRAHQLLRQDGKVAVWQRGRICLFISHQWLSFRHPDPEGKQLQVLRGALEKFLSGDLVVQASPMMEAVLSKRDLPKWDTRSEKAVLREAWLWYDFFSIPQVELGSPCLEDVALGDAVGIQDHRQTGEGSVMSDMIAAVSSIPVYVNLSHYFIIVAPPAYHSNTKEFCDFASWTRRGWCRVEIWSHLLREGRTMPVLLVKSDTWAQFVPTFQWIFWRAHEGDLTAESDRSIIMQLTDSMLQRKLKSMEASPQDATAQYLASMHRAFVGKSAVDIDEQTFKARFGLQSLLGGSPEELKGASFPPVMCAAIAGQPHLVKLCLSARCSVGAPLKRSVHGFINFANGTTALHQVCHHRPLRQLEVMEVLLQARADVNRPHGFGMPPLHLCTTPGAVELLLQHRADLHGRAGPGQTPLDACASIYGNAETLEALIRHRAVLEPSPKGFGTFPLMSAALFNDDTAEVVRVLVKSRANLDFTAKPQGATKFIGRALAAYYGRRMNGASPFVRMVADMDGNTALGAAASNGKAAMVLQLLDARASPCQGNFRGLTPQDLAEREGFFDLFSDMEIVASCKSDAAKRADVAASLVALGVIPRRSPQKVASV